VFEEWALVKGGEGKPEFLVVDLIFLN
jgi:hypothetical protein